MKLQFILSTLIFSVLVQAQNLVPNPSFEIHTGCPDDLSAGIGGDDLLKLAPPWNNCTLGSSDYFHECGVFKVSVPANSRGTEPAKDGVAYASILTYRTTPTNHFREYVQTSLKEPLEIGKTYQIKASFSLPERMDYASDQIGFLLSAYRVHDSISDEVLPYTPQITTPPGVFYTKRNGWETFCGTFIADSAYTYLTIGNFKNNTATNSMFVPGAIGSQGTAYYFIDDITIVPYNPNPEVTISASQTEICEGDSIFLTANEGFESYLWTYAGSTDTLSTDIFLSDSIEQTTTFQLKVYNECLNISDSTEITLIVDKCDSTIDPVDSPYFFIPNAFSPNEDGINDFLQIRAGGVESVSISIYNKFGIKILDCFSIDCINDQKETFKANETYILIAEVVFTDGSYKKLILNITSI